MENGDCCVYKVDKRNEVIDRAREIICEKSVAFLPSHYILKRWTKAAKCDVVVDDKGSEEACKILEDDLNNVLSKVKSVVRSDNISERHNSTPYIYNEPLAVKAKGCGKRLKGGKERQRVRQQITVGIVMDAEKLANHTTNEIVP
ncbi:hypothetical protein JRO89_XS04G0052700 [Xanthoceras sorbifolium]|uniref:Protein FAR1-RELATED SEQUENCE n=1 Tax=Xanthoceras sorbifolium TaxID=99658 RepID=A0ABQ8I4G6_9ROSI|nr:hypothetical protein JRO89_XS04G0052700 [Xanthoceras sorbifolium]